MPRVAQAQRISVKRASSVIVSNSSIRASMDSCRAPGTARFGRASLYRRLPMKRVSRLAELAQRSADRTAGNLNEPRIGLIHLDDQKERPGH